MAQVDHAINETLRDSGETKNDKVSKLGGYPAGALHPDQHLSLPCHHGGHQPLQRLSSPIFNIIEGNIVST